MIYDVMSYNGEFDILDLHLNILSPYVDRFVICEAKTTFSGNVKPLYFSKHEQSFKKFWKQIDYYIINEDYESDEIQLAEASPNTVGAKHWKNEFLQKESIKKALTKLNDDDICYIGDVDEIWEPYNGPPAKLKHLVYAYWLNNRSSEQFWGTLVAPWGYLKDKCLNHVRTDIDLRTKGTYGWHFTSMGGEKEVRRKLNDSYTRESYNTDDVQKYLHQRLTQHTDYLGREFTFTVDEKDWPEYLKVHKKKYAKLLTTRL